jgi:hypothetical protein
MNTIKNVMAKVAKIETERVELSSERVELGTIDDIKKLTAIYANTISKDYTNIFKEQGDVISKIQSLKSKSKIAYELYNKSYKEFTTLQQILKKQASDLGLNISEIKEYTDLVQLVDNNSRAYKTYDLVEAIKF